MQKLGKYLLADSLRACLAALLCVLLPWPGNAMAAVIVALVTMQRGSLRGLAVLAWTALPAIAASWKWHQVALFYDVAFVICFLCWLFASLLVAFKRWSHVLESVAVVGAVVTIVSFIMPTAWHAFIVTSLENSLREVITSTMQVDAKMVQQSLHVIAPYLLSLVYLVWALASVVYLMLARLWHLNIFAPNKVHNEFYMIRIGLVAVIATLLLITVALVFHKNWMIALSMIMILPFLFAGISNLFYFLATRVPSVSMRCVVMLLGFLLLMFFPRYTLLALVLLGFVDACINIRNLRIFRIKRVNG